MSAVVFVDTNILLYSIDADPASSGKRDAARGILMTEHWGWSVQVAGEFFVNAVSPKRPFRLSSEKAIACLEGWLSVPIVPLTIDLLRDALSLHLQFRISYWDATIIAAARQSGCRQLYSEDLNDGQDYGGVRVVNPFVNRIANQP